jgi:hypothetical protein
MPGVLDRHEAKTEAQSPSGQRRDVIRTSLGAVLPPLRSENPEWEVVPVAGDEELPVPDARRKQHRANGGRN